MKCNDSLNTGVVSLHHLLDVEGVTDLPPVQPTTTITSKHPQTIMLPRHTFTIIFVLIDKRMVLEHQLLKRTSLVLAVSLPVNVLIAQFVDHQLVLHQDAQ